MRDRGRSPDLSFSNNEKEREMPSADMKEHQVKYDYTNMLSEAVGDNGVKPADLKKVAKKIPAVFETLQKQRGEGVLGFMDLPTDETAVGSVMKLANSVQGRFDNLVILGIGGSALGPIALKSALCHPLHNMLDSKARGGRPRMFVLDNIDPDTVGAVLEFVKPENTLFNVITKSGSTAETISQLMMCYEAVSKAVGKNASEHFVATTDPEKGDLRKMAKDLGWRTLTIAPNVGGRFSVLTPVGLFPAAMLGIDVRQLLSGAAFMDRRSEGRSIEENPALAFAILQYALYQRGANISVLMPYSSALFDIADWYRQIWAESLGKKQSVTGETINVGPTPVKALGVTDQHSQVQLYAEGPFDKSITFMEVERFDRAVTIPKALSGYTATDYLAGHTMNELFTAEKKGTEVALTASGHPNGTLLIPEISAFTVGQVLYLFEMATAMSGALYGINAFDQPGVEAGKIAAYALMGRQGYEKKQAEIRGFFGKPRKMA
jgi:glucose-6-phosphate isomerase